MLFSSVFNEFIRIIDWIYKQVTLGGIIMIRKRAVLVVLIIAVISLGLLGCSNVFNDGGFTLVSTIPENEAEGVSPHLAEIVLEFNQEVKTAEVTMTDNLSLNVSKESKKVVITGFDLAKETTYQIDYTVEDSEQSISGSLEFTTSVSTPEIPEDKINETMMQAFYWEMNTGDYASDYPEEADLWELLQDRASKLSEVGITALWLPPANKAMSGTFDVGYGTYDLWDLGEFNQKGTVRTKYGTKSELVSAIDAIHQAGMKAYYDIIFNHRMGADSTEQVTLSKNSPDKREETIKAWTNFDLAGRQEYYSKAENWFWNWEQFDGVDFDDGEVVGDGEGDKGKFLFKGKDWGWIDGGGSNDYLMGADVDYSNWENEKHQFNTKVVDEMKAWGQWITEDIGFDGFRIDAIKHVDNLFIAEWIDYMQANVSKDLFFVGEAWIGDVSGLQGYIDSLSTSIKDTDNVSDKDISDLHVFDFPLRGKFAAMRDGGGSFDMSEFSGGGLLNSDKYSGRAVSFVDNHDTSRDESEYGNEPISSYAYQAYTYILTRKGVVPTVFWKDYYQYDMKEQLDKLLRARRYFAYGSEHEGPTDEDVYSYVREGLDDVAGTGLVMLISDGTSGTVASKSIDSGRPNVTYIDITGNISTSITTDSNGEADFKVKKSETAGYSVWVPAEWDSWN